MKRKTFPFLPVLLALGTAGCDVDPASQTIQRDVYTRMEDCVADWGNQDLCKQMEMAQAGQKPAQSSSGGSAGSSLVYIHGPGYYGGDRAVNYGGQTYRPTGAAKPVSTNSFSKTGSFIKNTPSAASQSGAVKGGSSSSVPRSGFGATGARAGGGAS